MIKKYALVTGADRGVGVALVEALINKGYFVFAGQYLHEGHTWSTLALLQHQNLKIISLDVTDDTNVSHALEEIKCYTSHLDLLINNAAILGDITKTIYDEIEFDKLEDVYKVNAIGALRVTHAFIPLIMDSETKLIVNISSEAGSIEGNTWRNSWFAYCMSKAALNMQSKLIHNHISKQGGKVLVIHPGHVQTYMQGKLDTEGALTASQSANYIMKQIEKSINKTSDSSFHFIDYEGHILPW